MSSESQERTSPVEIDTSVAFATDDQTALWLWFAAIALWAIFSAAGLISVLAVLQGDVTALLPVIGIAFAFALVFLSRTKWGSLEVISPSGVEWISLRGTEGRIPLSEFRSFGWSSLGYLSWRDALSASTRGRSSFVHLYSGGFWNRRRWYLVCPDVRAARNALLEFGIDAHPLHPWADPGDA